MAKRVRPVEYFDVPIKRKPAGAAVSTYNPRVHPKSAAFLASRGSTLSEIALAFDISTDTVNEWQNKYPEFQEAILKGTADQFDPRVERSLAERALGYSVVLEEKVYNRKGKVIATKQVRRYFPPDVTACIFWLKNRQPDRWRDVQRHEFTTALKSADELRSALANEIKELMEQGLLALPAPVRKMREINPRGNGHG